MSAHALRAASLLGATVALAASASASPPAATTPARPRPDAPAGWTSPKHPHKPKRHGGHVRRAWPADRHAPRPRSPLARWLARQVGPAPRRSAARAAAAADSGKLLIRSFDVPPSDATAYARLANRSYTYDDALATFAFISVGARGQAEQLLDQLKALQRTDGSLEYAFDVRTGESVGQFRAGAMAWVAYAALAYRETYDNSRYDDMLAGIVRYLLALRNKDGLIAGGPDVTWVSTQHNLLADGMLRDLAADLGPNGTLATGIKSVDINNAANEIGNAILASLIVQDGPLAHFREGVGDEVVPSDVQALGALWLAARGDGRARQVAETLRQKFYVAPRDSAVGTLSGYRPFLGDGAPDVIWSEGTIEAATTFRRLGVDATAADDAVDRIRATIGDNAVGPAGADRDVVDPSWGEFHTWPTSAAASWLLIRATNAGLLFAR
jgi:hypothetical protein